MKYSIKTSNGFLLNSSASCAKSFLVTSMDSTDIEFDMAFAMNSSASEN
jgi:hypothetical protein